MDDPLDQPSTAQPLAPPAAATTSPQQPRYPTMLPGDAGLAPPHAAAAPAVRPYSPSPSPSAVASPYGEAALLYGAVGATGGRGSAPPPGAVGAAASASAAQLADGLQAMSLRQQQSLHHYGSAPDLPSFGTVSASSPALGAPSASTIGVAGIVKREQQKTAESGRAVEQAFRDLSALMSSAATMVALAEKFRGVMAAGADGAGAAGGGGAGGEDPLLLDAETQQQLIALGISSPVTRETAGARYHIELSRQLADFLAAPLQRCGGLMSLPDVYCLFNRARGTELVSPDDLLQARPPHDRRAPPPLTASAGPSLPACLPACLVARAFSVPMGLYCTPPAYMPA
ncbi:hypothetical protein GPECTOR_12g440 [Gonium pectorale]|uniref:Vacuolar protein-sorting-associated protein 36 n=1 Tax=Gonium pectorale TaxID=33097 RepID=A0A150GNT2_GONPE|nr:hypothetical protein GPECTOR_12g440 [Gonium pectorale]|eukprot:KXZ51477.1 hypothetical protein GPECTOR_12g440 [Gonium pectorale]